MIINIEAIEKLIFEEKYSIYEIAKACNIPSRSSLNKARNTQKIDNLTLETVKKLQNFINEERTKMKYAVVVNLEDKNGRRIDVNFDTLVAVEETIEDVEKFIDDDKDSSSYNKAEKITYAVYEVNDEILEDENDEFGDVLEMGTNIVYELNRDEYGEFRLEIEFTNEMRKEVIEEAMESIGSTLNLAVYSDGSTALVDQNTQVREEFDGEIERICTLNLSPEYWQDTFEENELDMYDFTIEDLKEKELYDEIYESFEIQIDSYLNN